MSTGNNLSTVSNCTDLYEEELMTWLQYPMDDAFERNYCSDLFGEWSPTAEAAKSHPDVNLPAGSSVDMEMNPCAGSGSSKLATKKKMVSKPLIRSSSNAEEALALGAERAAGRSSQVGLDAFNKVRTSMKLQENSQRSVSCASSLKAVDVKNGSVKPSTLPVPSVPFACKPIEVGVLSSPNISRLYRRNTLSKEKTKHATSESTTFTSKRSRKDYEPQSQLSNTRQSGSSHITEDDRIKQGKKTCGDGKVKRTPVLCSEGSQTSMSLSFKEVTYSGKRKLDDSEFLSEDADVDSMDIRKPCKSSARRNRVAEIHNLSERNRRNRINEKLKALQDLIPNSNKTDKASMLDEAIEYTKTLQMQLQMVSMRSGMNVSPTGMPMALPQTPLHMAPLQSVGLGVPISHAGMGMGMDIGFPVNLPPYCAGRPFQGAPATMIQYGMPFQNGSTSGLQDGNQVYAPMGFVPSQSLPVMQKFQELPDQTCPPMSPSTSYVQQCQQQEQGQDLGHRSLNHKHEAHRNEQEGISGQKDWKQR
eukprot:c22570_g1_i2 orf=426-2021(+)